MLILHGPKFPMDSLVFSPDGKWLVAARRQKGPGAYRWDSFDGASKAEVIYGNPGVNSVYFSPGGERMVFDGSRVVVRTVATGTDVVAPVRDSGGSDWVYACVTPDGQRMILGLQRP